MQANLLRRIVVKAGTNLLTSGGDKLDFSFMSSLVNQVIQLHDRGVEVALVSSGAVAAGRHALGTRNGQENEVQLTRLYNKRIPFRQVLAAVGQSKLMREYDLLFSKQNVFVAQALLTRRDIADRAGYLNIRNTLVSLLSLGVVPILNENDVVESEELEGDSIGDNDTLSALVANLIDADLLVLLGDTEGLYTADPNVYVDATLITHVENIETLQAQTSGTSNTLGRGGMVTKIEAARLATSSGTPVVIAHGNELDVLLRLTSGELIGTWFSPTSNPLESRQRWMLSIMSPNVGLQIDKGAVKALIYNYSSLLPAGIQMTKGKFKRGEVVPILNEEGSRIAVGIVNYDVDDIEKIMGLHSELIGTTLGHEYGEEVVHRNNLVLL